MAERSGAWAGILVGMLAAGAVAAPPPADRAADLATIYRPAPAAPVSAHDGPVRKELEKVLLHQARYLNSLLRPCPETPGGLRLTDGGSLEAGIRPNTSTAAGLAIVSRVVPPGRYPEGLTPDLCRDRAIAILRFVLPRHGAGGGLCTDGKPWRDQWQSAYWAYGAGRAAWLLWDRLDDDLRWLAARMVCDEADRFTDAPPPFQVRVDTKAEENAWNSTVISLAFNMFPHHPRREAYRQAAVRWAASAFARAADVGGGEIVDGRPIGGWIGGANIHDDFTLENHLRVHPDYMTTWTLNAFQRNEYVLGGNPPPAAIVRNAREIYAVGKFLSLPDGGFIYPNGQDWSLRRIPDWVAPHGFQAAVFGDAEAARLLRLSLETAGRMAARDPDGGLYVEGENTFASSQPMSFEQGAKTLLVLAAVGEGPEPAAEEALWRGLRGARTFEPGRFAVVRSERGVATFAWGDQVMGQVVPIRKDLLLNPDERSLVGTADVEGAEREAPQVGSVQRTEIPGGFGIAGVLDRAGGRLEQKFAFAALPDGRVVWADAVRAKSACRVRSLRLGRLGILNDARWVYHDGDRTIHAEGGSKSFAAVGGEPGRSSGADEPSFRFRSRWVNVDDALGILCLSSAGQDYLPNRRPERGRIEQPLSLNVVDARDAAAGEVLATTVLVLDPLRTRAETERAAAGTVLTENPGGRFEIRLEDGAIVRLDLERSSVEWRPGTAAGDAVR